jgi:hypothetical protein
MFVFATSNALLAIRQDLDAIGVLLLADLAAAGGGGRPSPAPPPDTADGGKTWRCSGRRLPMGGLAQGNPGSGAV